MHCEIALHVGPQAKISERQKALEGALRPLGFVECRQVIRGRFQMEANSDRAAKLSQEATPIGLLFANQIPRREFQIETEKLVLSDYAYDSFDEFIVRLSSYVDAACDVLGIDRAVAVTKVGLRKVNAVQISPVSSLPEALGAFNPALFNIPRSGLVGFNSFRGAEEVMMVESGQKLGLLRTSLEKQSESSLAANLDFDFISKISDTLARTFEKTLPELNQSIFDLFMWAVTADLIDLMENS